MPGWQQVWRVVQRVNLPNVGTGELSFVFVVTTI